jgi:hypothetical protein
MTGGFLPSGAAFLNIWWCIPIMNDQRHQKLSNGTVMVDNDPYVVYNDKMKNFAKKMFDDAEKRGYTSKEDKARYLSGKIFEMSPFGVYKDSMSKNAIELFDGLVSDDKEKHYLACVHKGIVQRALLESQGVKTRNDMFEIIPFTYPMKPVKSRRIKVMNDLVQPIGKQLAKGGFNFPHFTMDAWICKDEEKQLECDWKTMDATFDDTTRLLEIRPEIDPKFIVGEDHPATVGEWRRKYLDSNDFITTLYKMAEDPATKGMFRKIFDDMWFGPLMDANEHVDGKQRDAGKEENGSGLLERLQSDINGAWESIIATFK